MNSQPGIFTLSLDTEIAWGTFDVGGLHRYAHHFNEERQVVRRLVSLLDKYQIPATWAFVGHLLLDSCQQNPDGLPHPEVLRPSYRWYPHDWHHLDPCTDWESDPWWYGPDLVRMVLNSPIKHEIGTHTFSHIVVGDTDCTEEIFRSQLTACVDAHRTYGLNIGSIVYPRNSVAFLDVLSEYGITAYRGCERRWYAHRSPRLVKILRLLDRTLAFTPTTYAVTGLVEGDRVNLPASMFLVPRDGVRRLIPMASRVSQAERGLKRAAERGELFHLWFHPFNLASDPRLFEALEVVLARAAALRETGGLSILTMQQASELAKASVRE